MAKALFSPARIQPANTRKFTPAGDNNIVLVTSPRNTGTGEITSKRNKGFGKRTRTKRTSGPPSPTSPPAAQVPRGTELPRGREKAPKLFTSLDQTQRRALTEQITADMTATTSRDSLMLSPRMNADNNTLSMDSTHQTAPGNTAENHAASAQAVACINIAFTVHGCQCPLHIITHSFSCLRLMAVAAPCFCACSLGRQ